jgi:pimeloyl-ACP methyl ester carboxylesterase
MLTESDRILSGLATTEYRCNDPAAPVLVLLHSMTFSKATWAEACRTLAERFRCLAIDLPGHGDSVSVDRFTTIPDMANSIAGLIEGEAIESAVIVGNSMGGTVGVALANQHPALVSDLVLVGAAVWETEPDRRAWLKSRAGFFDSDGSIVEPGPEIVAELFGTFDEDRYRLMLSDRRSAADSLESSLWALYSYDISLGLAGVRQPVLAVFGSNDPYRVSSTAVIRNHVARLNEVTIDGGSHVLPIDKPVELAAAIAHWLDVPLNKPA